jgi:hypothetical protein
MSRRRCVGPSATEGTDEAPRGDPKPKSPVVTVVTPEAPAEDQHPEDSGGVSVTNSEVESVMSHRRRKAALRHSAFSEQEFNALSSVDAYLGAARTGLEGAAKLMSANMQV